MDTKPKTRWEVLYVLLLHPVNGVIAFGVLWAVAGQIENADILVVSSIVPIVLRGLGLLILLVSMYSLMKRKGGSR